MRLLVKWSVPFLSLFTIFAEQIFHCYLSIIGVTSESGMLQYVFIAVFGGAMFLLIYDNFHKVVGYKSRRILLSLLVILFLYIMTSGFYGAANPRYYSTILRYGSICVGGAIIGMHIAKFPCFRQIDSLLPMFIMPFGLVIGTLGLQAAAVGEILQDESGLRYQNVSYYMSEMYAYSAYYVFFSSARHTYIGKCLKYPMLGMMLFCAAICLLSGGRGAFVFIITVTLLILYLLRKVGRMTGIQVVFLVIVGLCVFALIAVKMDIFNSVGFDRIANHLSDDDIRDSLRQRALEIFFGSPIFGHGIGSIWMTLGFYSHNMFLDLLVEGGLILVLIVFRILYLIVKRLFILAKSDYSYIFFLLVFSKTFLVTMFSGYWISAYQLWLIFGFVMVMPFIGNNPDEVYFRSNN